MKSQTIRLYPNNNQQQGLDCMIKAFRIISNLLSNGTVLEKTSLNVGRILPWTKDYPHTMVQSCIKNHNKLEKMDCVKFISKNDRFFLNRGYSIKHNRIYIKGIEGGIKFKPTIRLTGLSLDIKIRHTNTEKYQAVLKGKSSIEDKVLGVRKDIVSLDMGLDDYIVTSDNERVKHPNWNEKVHHKIEMIKQQINSKATCPKYRDILIKNRNYIYEKAKYKRIDFLHKISSYLTTNYKCIVIEDLCVKSMSRHVGLRNRILDSSFYTFKKMLLYKGLKNDCEIIVVPRYFASTKICNTCKRKKHNLTFNDREWTCIYCNAKNDRDLNACRNLLDYAKLNKVREPFKAYASRD